MVGVEDAVVAHIVVLGNEKGGTGKSTTAMHVFTALSRSGQRVGAIDLDLRQQSFFRYLENRRNYAVRGNLSLSTAEQETLSFSTHDHPRAAEKEEETRFAEALTRLDRSCDVIIIDCPGAFTRYSRMAHAAADTLITPLNDSMVDFDMLARFDAASGAVAGPSIYSEMVWSCRRLRQSAELPPLDWVVLRNRVSMLEAHNKRRVGKALTELSSRIGFRLVPGFSERVVFRELFVNGLTLLDLPDLGEKLSMSRVAARQEVRELLRALKLPGLNATI